MILYWHKWNICSLCWMNQEDSKWHRNHLTWPDQKIYRGQLQDLAKIVHDHNLTLTTMLVVGEAIDNRQGLSELYNKYFTHLFRKGE